MTQSGAGTFEQGAELAEDAAVMGVGQSALLPDPRVLLMVLRRRWWVFLLAVVATLGAVATYVTLAPRIYSASSTVLIEPLRGDPVSAGEFSEVERAAGSDFVETQILIIDSTRNAVAVVKALDLVDDPEFGGQVDAAILANATPAERA